MDAGHSISRLAWTLALLAGPAPVAAQDGAAPDAAPAEAARPAGWRLADSASPYLHAHADNPVEWWPWGDAAFAHARELGRPVFLSIGYSACHWCHRMEHDTFEDGEVARRLNERFVCIKVDREERPDLDARYMNALVLMTGGGGWPASLFLLPDGRPFFGGTYFPARSGALGPGFLDVLDRLHQLWTEERTTVEEAAGELHDVLARDPLPAHALAVDLTALLGESATLLASSLDGERGGLHGAPKFPPVLTLQYLLRQHLRTGLAVQELIEVALDAMSSGGLCDHVGGGFFRYCVDDGWETPHFEKMLAGNAQLALLYAEAAVALGQPRWADVARETLAFVSRELRLPSGLFAGSLDADSAPVAGERAEEGRFYLWTPEQLEDVLGDSFGSAFAQLHHVTREGTFLEAGQPTGLSLPRPMRTVPALAANPGPDLKPGDEFVRWRALSRVRLGLARDARPRPFRDDKALAAWNGLLLSAFARTASLQGNDDLLAESATLALVARAHLVARDEALLRVHHHLLGDATAGRGDLLDTAALARGLLDAYEAGGDPANLLDAFALARALVARFQEPTGAFWDTELQDPRLPSRGRHPWDGSEPAGSSVAVEVLLRLAPLDDTGLLEASAVRALERLAPLAAGAPGSLPALLSAIDAALGPLAEVVLDGEGEPRRALVDVLRARVLPAALVVPDARRLLQAISDEREAARAAGRAPLFAEDPALLAGRRAPEGEARAWVCVRRACLLPAATPEELAGQLDGVARRGPAAAPASATQVPQEPEEPPP